MAPRCAVTIHIKEQQRHMPSLFRFLFVTGLLGGIAFGGLYVLSEFFEPEPREVTSSVPGVKVRK
jgi:hypothetical protein